MIRNITVCLSLLVTITSADPLIVAHRGASHIAPENTVAAFDRAWELGADAIEGDFHLTSDGKIICIHDYNTARVSGTKLIVKESTLAELQALDAGEWFGPEWKGVRLPTFGEVAATVPADKKIYIEIKCGPEIIPELLRELKSTGLSAGQVVVISFNAPAIRELKNQAPGFKAIWLSSFKKESPLDPSVETVLKTLREIQADGFSSINDVRLDAEYVHAIRNAGFEYHTWTIDEPAVADKFIGFGAMSITTNRPDFLRKGMKKP